MNRLESFDPRAGKPSASGLYRIALCPASWQAERKCPVPPPSDDAAFGTRMHSHMELGTMPEDADEVDAIQHCRTMEQQLRTKYAILGPAVREKRLWEQHRAYSGQQDVIFFNADQTAALVIDYKFGRLPVEPPGDNWQLHAQSLLVLDNYTHVDTVYSTILQPYVSREEPQLLEITRDMQDRLRATIHAPIIAAGRANADFCPGTHQCRYCRAIDSCPALRNRVNEVSTADLKDWIDWSPEKKAEMWQLSRLAKRLADGVEKRVKADLKAGITIPGLSIGSGRTCFKITDAQAAFSILNSELGISAEAYTAACSVSISKVDQMVYEHLKAEDPATTARKSDALVRELLASCGTTTTTEGSIKESK